jgi:hypothetical protein
VRLAVEANVALDYYSLRLRFCLVQQGLGLLDLQFADHACAEAVCGQIHTSLQLLHCCVEHVPFRSPRC